MTPLLQISMQSPQPLHLIILIHGLDGFSTDFDFLASRLTSRFTNIRLFIPSVNQYKTRDGILNGAKRILEALKLEIDTEFEKIGGYLSIVGHSLGGLYGRALAGLLLNDGIIPSRFKPLNFVTLSTPHLGSREQSQYLGSTLTSFILSLALRKTGLELMLVDRPHPFLVELSEEKWTAALKLFERLTVYSNTRYDISVHYSTAAIKGDGSLFELPGGFKAPSVHHDDTIHPIKKINNDDKVALDKSFEVDMLENLSKLKWKRYAVIPARPVLAHVDILVKNSVPGSFRSGQEVVAHIVDHFRHPNDSLFLDTLVKDEAVSLLPSLEDTVHLVIVFGEALGVLTESLRDAFPRHRNYKVVLFLIEDGWLINQIKHSHITRISMVCVGEAGATFLRRLLSEFYDLQVSLANIIFINTPFVLEDDKYVEQISKFENRVLYANLGFKIGLLATSDFNLNMLSHIDIKGSEKILSIDLEPDSNSSGLASLSWKRFVIVYPIDRFKLQEGYWDADQSKKHPILDHIKGNIL